MNNYYEVLTENGFKGFHAVASKTVDKYLTVFLENDIQIKCTTTHRFRVGDDFMEAELLQPGYMIQPLGTKVVHVESIFDEIEVFDIVEVDGGNHYLTNSVTSHNCDFLSTDGGLMDSYVMSSIQKEVAALVPEFSIQENDSDEIHHFYYKINPLSTYIIGVDPATGSGLDFTSIQIVEFPAMRQVMEWRSNVMSAPVVYKMLKKLIQFIAQTGANVYFSAENNGVGQSIIALYMSDETPPVGTFISEEGKAKLGIVTTGKSKIRTCVKLKNMVEKRAVTITSSILVQELKNYVRKAGSYAAQIGSTDDSIAAMLIVIRIIEEIANFDSEAYHMMFAFEAPETWVDEGYTVDQPEQGYSIPVSPMQG